MTLETYDEGLNTMHIIRSIALSTLTFIIIVGNALVLFILPRVKSCKGNPRMFLTSLTIADMLVGLFVGIPMSVSSMANDWIFGVAFCSFTAGARLFFNIEAVLSLLAVTVDRYLAIAYPLRYHTIMTQRKSICILFAIWAFAFFLPFIYGPLLKHTPAKYLSEHCMCYFIGSDANEFDWSIICCLFVFVLTPFVITTVIYTKLFIILRRHDAFVAQFKANSTNKTKKMNFMITFLFVIIYYAIAWVPFVLMRLTMLFTGFTTPKEVDMLMEILISMNNGINIVTYYFKNKDFKTAAVKLICPVRKNPNTGSSDSPN